MVETLTPSVPSYHNGARPRGSWCTRFVGAKELTYISIDSMRHLSMTDTCATQAGTLDNFV